MSFVRPIDLNGMLQRTQEVSAIKQNEDKKPVQDQYNIQHVIHKNIGRTSRQVVEKDNAQNDKYKYDAKEKGNGHYSGNSNNKQEKQKKEQQRVIVKNSRHVDIKI